MRKTRFDTDVTHTIRQCPESTSATLATYLALRELATEAGSCNFVTSCEMIKARGLVSDSALRKALDIMQRRNILHRKPALKFGKNCLRIKLLKLRVLAKNQH